MEQFGEYEVIKRIPPVENSRIFTFITRRKTGPAGAEFVVRALRPAESAEGVDPGLSELDGPSASHRQAFFEAIRLQKQACNAGARHLAPVHELKDDATGVWYTTDFYRRGTLKKPISGRYDVDGEDIWHLVKSVLEGLLDFKQCCGRSHGNLIPNNILLGGPEGKRLQHAPVFLYEPLPGGTEKSAAYEIADLHGLGEIIFQLVRRREMRAATQWPLQPSEDWSRLGEYGERWRELCNTLLDPSLSLENFNFERLEWELEKLKVEPSRWKQLSGAFAKIRRLQPGRGLLLGVLGGLVVLAAVCGYWLHARTRGIVEITSEPTGAGVWEGSKQIGTTPFHKKVKPGDVEYNVMLDGYVPTNIVLTVTSRETVSNDVQLLPLKITVPIVLSTDPPGVEIIVDGQSVGTTPLSRELRLGPGPHDLTARYQDWPVQTKHLQVAKGTPARVSFEFVLGSLEIDSEPSGATVLAGGREIGRTKLTIPGLKPGSVTYELWLDGYARTNVTATIKARDTVLRAIRLQVLETTSPAVKEETPSVPARPAMGHGGVVVDSEPQGASVLVDGNELGRTPLTNATVDPGVVSYELRKDGYLRDTVTTMIVPNQLMVLRQKLLGTNVGAQLILTSNLQHVEFMVNKHSIGTPKPPVYLAVAPGTYEISARFMGLAEVKALPQKIKAADVWEFPFPFNGSCTNILNTEPKGAMVFVGSKSVGKTPFTNIVTLADVVDTDGKIIYRLEMEGYVPQIITNDYGGGKITVRDWTRTP